MRLTTMPERLRDRGLTVVTHGAWATLGSATFHPRGVVCHHTGPWKTVPGMVQLCINGRSDLPGPLCQVVLAPDGACHVIAAGRANHAGPGGWAGLVGNTNVVGIEAIHSGALGAAWPAVQLAAFTRCAAAICELLGITEDMVCGHKEWAPARKVDPVGLDMAEFRYDVAEHLAAWAPPPTPMEVPPMFTPFTVAAPIVGTLKAPGGGVWMLDEGGHVYGLEGAVVTDMPARHPEYWQPSFKARRLEPLGAGFTVVRDNGSRYDYGA